MIKVNPKLTVEEIAQMCRNKGTCTGCEFFDRKELECVFNGTPPEDFDFETDSQEEN